MASERSSSGSDADYQKILFEYQSRTAQLESTVKELELQVEKLKKENAKLKRQIANQGKKSRTKKSGLEEFGASFE